MKYVMYRFSYEYGEMMDASMVACADSIEKLIAYYEQITGQQAQLQYEESEDGYSARWILKNSGYEIQEVKGL